MRSQCLCLLGVLLAASAVVVHADTLLVDAIANSPTNNAQGIPRPTRGMSMQSVKQHFGEPGQTHAQVGDPPITRWDYADYSVFFENQTVLTSVLHR